MNPLYTRLNELRKKYNVSWELLEQDYLLSWVLAGIARIPQLRKIMILKGGTALKKNYFGDYRFSQDLDFTILGKIPDDKELEKLMNMACEEAMRLQAMYGYPMICARS